VIGQVFYRGAIEALVQPSVRPEVAPCLKTLTVKELIGSHGGLGGPQTRPLIVHPADWALDEDLVGAEAVYADVWTSMGREAEQADRRAAFVGFTVDSRLMRRASASAIFLHCLPAHRGEEVTDEVIDGPASRVWPQAANRLHTETALLYSVLTGDPDGKRLQ